MSSMTDKITARELGYRAFHAGLWPRDNPFTQPALREAWHAAWTAENHKHVERLRQQEKA